MYVQITIRIVNVDMKFWQSGYNPQIRLSQRELLEISQRISQEFTPSACSALPELVLLPVDPFHIYAYWNLGRNNLKSKPNDHTNFQLILRIYYQPNQSSSFYNTKQWFDVTVNRIKHQQKVAVPNDHTFYSAVIGKHYVDDSFAAYAYSNIIHVPRSEMAVENEKGKFANKSNLPETGDTSSLAEVNDSVLNDFIMKDNLYVESMDTPMNLDHNPAVTSPPVNVNNDSGLGINQ